MNRKAQRITPRSTDFSQWYVDVVKHSGLAEHSAVKGCMVIKPHGYAIWEKIRDYLDRRFKETGHVNAYFPLFIPKSFLAKEAEHVEGFAKECAVVTHYRLKLDPQGGLIVDPDARLDEELIVRPTSETIIWNTYRNWIHSYRDLPILINQWANVVRWEMRTRLFLRTAEFLWQEGHTAHATEREAREETLRIIDIYEELAREVLAVPVLKGRKSDQEKFAGAVDTYTIEGLMQDGKALQMGTSHFLGQNFARAFDVKFLNAEGRQEYVWATSWGVSTRLIGALIMTHADDRGLVLPPRVAPLQVVIVPIYRSAEQLDAVRQKVAPLVDYWQRRGLTVRFDDDDNHSPGWKFHEYELKGVPVRVTIGPRDLDAGTAEVARRDTGEKQTVAFDQLGNHVIALLDTIQQAILQRAEAMREERTYEVDTWDEFQRRIEEGGFVVAGWDGSAETEAAIKEQTKATIRLIPEAQPADPGRCVFSGRPAAYRVVFARAY